MPLKPLSRAQHSADRRRSPFILPNGKLQTSLDYKLLAPQRDADTTPKFT
jgi:hypothetical protein